MDRLLMTVIGLAALIGVSGSAGAPLASRDDASLDRSSGGRAAYTIPFNRKKPPLCWTWQVPLGAAADLPNVIRIVRHQTYRAPAEVADRVCDEILSRGLGPGEACILLQNFGMGDGDPISAAETRFPALFRHWDDGVSPDAPLEDAEQADGRVRKPQEIEWWLTPWMSAGISECSAWMNAFIDQYEARQVGDPAIPDPTRFHFDSERIVAPHFNALGPIGVFRRMMDDPRWATEPLPGHDGKAVAQLYQEAGAPAFDSMKGFDDPANRAWTIWYAGVCFRAADAAMDAAAYELIRTAWPGCLSSNYSTSARSDGLGDPPRQEVVGRHREWFRFHHDSFADLQAPTLYWVQPEEWLAGETAEDAVLRRTQERLDVHIHSYGGPYFDVVPWTQPVSSRMLTRFGEPTWTRSLELDMLALFRSRGVNELLLWSNGSTQARDSGWTAFAECVDRVWSVNLVHHVVESGLPDTTDLEPLRFALRDPMGITSVQPIGGGSNHECELRARFVVGSAITGPPQALRIAVDAGVDVTGAQLSVLIHDWSIGQDVLLESSTVGPDLLRSQVIHDGDAIDHVDPGGRVDVVLRFEHDAAFVADVDGVQVYVDEP